MILPDILAEATPAVYLLIGIFLGGAAIYLLVAQYGKRKMSAARREAEGIVEEARKQAEVTVKTAQVEAKSEFINRLEEFEQQSAKVREELKESERRLDKRADNLDKKLDTLTSKERMLEQEESKLKEQEEFLVSKEQEIAELREQEQQRLLQITGMSLDEARKTLLESIRSDVEHDATAMVDKILTEAKETAEEQSREVVVTAIQRYASEHTSASTVSTIDIPSDDMKGRVIGREGRNIRAFEKASGVDVIVDDTPGVVVVSAFDPVRREIARIALERLIQDGRIHPSRIEEMIAETSEEVARQIVERGKKAAVEANVGGLNQKLIDLLGRLSFRTSYGQNVLQHSTEVAYLCQVMADELGLDGTLARRCGLLHDIGKAVDHEVEGGHPQIGAQVIMGTWRRPVCTLRWWRQRTRSVLLGRAVGGNRWSVISSGWSSWSRLPVALTG